MKALFVQITREDPMMHQSINPATAFDRPVRDAIIQKDEIISLKIDLETLSLGEFYGKYFSDEDGK